LPGYWQKKIEKLQNKPEVIPIRLQWKESNQYAENSRTQNEIDKLIEKNSGKHPKRRKEGRGEKINESTKKKSERVRKPPTAKFADFL
jgi:hypothetical protein